MSDAPPVLGVLLLVVAIAVLLAVLAAAGAVVAAVVVAVRRAVARRRGGLDPAAGAGRAAVPLSERLDDARSGFPSPPPLSLERRLRELDDLLSRGVITADEHAAARARLLGTLPD